MKSDWRARLRPALLLLTALLLPGCASLTGISQQDAFSSPPPAVELTEVPFFPQEAYQCGPAALAEVLGWAGEDVSPEELKPSLFIPGRKGTLQAELITQSRQRNRVPYQLDGTFDALIAELEAGNPVLVFQNLSLAWRPVWHYAVIVGYDPEKAGFILRSGEHKRVFTSLDTFRRTWERADRWAIVVMPPDRLPATATPQAWLSAAADLEQTGRHGAAIHAYKSGLTRWPEQAGFHLGLFNTHYASGNHASAEAAARRGLEQAADHHGVLYNNLANLLGEQSRWTEAERAAEAAVASGGRFQEMFEHTLERLRCRGDPACLGQLDD